MSDYGDEALRRLEYNDVIRENGLLLAENDELRERIKKLEFELAAVMCQLQNAVKAEIYWKEQATQ